MLTCFLYRRRIGAWLDGALPEPAERATGRHVAGCRHCAAEAESLRRLRALVAGLPAPQDLDWTGFWPGVVRRIEDERRVPVGRSGRGWPQLRWAYGGLAAALVLSLAVWQLVPASLNLESPVIVRSAGTDYPAGHVMVYSTPERDLTVVWVVGVD